MRRGALAAAVAALLCLAAASDPAERLADPAQEHRARALFQTLRCVVCQNESIDDSDAELAADLRRIVRGQIARGKTDAEVRGFLVERYGDFILLKPPFNPGNALLWLTPALIVGLGGAVLVWKGRRPAKPETGLSEDEILALQALVGEDTVPPHSGLNNG